MASEEDFLFRPIAPGYYTLRELLDGTLSLADVAKANEYMDVVAHNQDLAREAIGRG